MVCLPFKLVRLVRDGNDAKDSTLGELLKMKSQEGVRVLLLVWNDPTSNSILGYKTVSTKLVLFCLALSTEICRFSVG